MAENTEEIEKKEPLTDTEVKKMLASLGKKKKGSINGTTLSTSIDENNVVLLEEIPEPKQDFKYYEITKPLIKYFTNKARQTFEYNEYIQFLKQHLDINRCSFYENYSMDEGYTIELHHTPFTLYDITEAVARKQFEMNQWVKTFKVTEEVAFLHFTFKVGLTPLNPTAHELVHSGSLKLHPKLCISDGWRLFYEEYNPYLSDEALYKYQEYKMLLDDNAGYDFPKILEYKPVTLEIPSQNRLITNASLNLLIEERKINPKELLLE